MDDILVRVWENLIARSNGPMNFRLVIQPMVAAALAIRSGLKDARAGRPAFFWAALTKPAHRSDLLRQGWKDIGKVFVFALVLDAIDQFIVRRTVYVGELLIVATALAIVPYILIRGPVTRVAKRLSRSTGNGSEKQSSPIVEEKLRGEQYDKR
jgi:hypothetical protein